MTKSWYEYPRVAFVGSREYPLPHLVSSAVRVLKRENPTAVVVSGGARGPDGVAELAALRLGMAVRIHPANWSRDGRGAGFARNADIVRDADVVLAFWDRISRGTRDTIDRALAAGKPVGICDGHGEWEWTE